MDGGKDKKAIVYNTKGGEKEKKEEKEKTRRIVYFQVIILEHVRGYFLYLYRHITLSF